MFIKKIENKIKTFYRRHIKRDAFLIEAERWFKDKGDETLRLNYPLSKESIVFDIGGYHGDFAFEINKRYGCQVYVFEPVREFYEICKTRFQNNNNIVILNFGLSSTSGRNEIALSDNGSSFHLSDDKENKEWVEVRSAVDYIQEIGINRIDLLKVNIEGGEYELLPALINSDFIKNINYIQIQFHNFVHNSFNNRNNIREHLAKTHKEIWNYTFIWECWKLLD